MSYKYLCFGDCRAFFFNTDNCLAFDYHGSTLSGLGKRESVLNIRDKITKEIKLYYNKNVNIILKFGQVDIELVYWYKIIEDDNLNNVDENNLNLRINNLYSKLISAYKIFIDYIITIVDKKNIIIFGIDLPSIIDNDKYINWIVKKGRITKDPKEYIYKLKSILFTPEKRTIISINFNKLLKNMCLEMNIKYTDNISDVLDTEKNILKKKYHSIDNEHIYNNINNDLYINKVINLI